MDRYAERQEVPLDPETGKPVINTVAAVAIAPSGVGAELSDYVAQVVSVIRESGLPNEMGLIKNQYVARTFIQPTQALREQGVRMKLSAVKSVVKGKRIIVIDDSIVRGTTSKRIVDMLREAGAEAAHQLTAAEIPVLLRHRHLDDAGAHRREEIGRGNPRVHRRGFARVPLRGRPD